MCTMESFHERVNAGSALLYKHAKDIQKDQNETPFFLSSIISKAQELCNNDTETKPK